MAWDWVRSPPEMGKRFLSVVLASVVVAACGGGASTTTTASAGASAAATTAATTARTTAPTAAATSAAPAGPGLADLLAASKNATYKITYKITATGGGAEAMNGTQTWYFKPPRSRFDFNIAQGGQNLQISFYSLPEGQIYCTVITGAGATCFSVKGAGSPADSNIAMSTQSELINNPSKYGATFTGTKTFAGLQGNCYDVKSTVAAGAFSGGSFCYSKEGIPLLQSFTASAQGQSSSWTVEATNYSATVADSDFTPPAKPIN